MIDSWAIGVNIEINDNILAALDRLYNEFDRVERAVALAPVAGHA